jgi:hypothetical protein
VDPYFYALLDVVFKIDEEGESSFELEEAYGVTTALPASLQLKVGQFFTEFGRTNPVHPHAWEFLNQPVVLGRVFGGDGFRGQGARLSWLGPVTVIAGAQNARGETQAPFLGEEGEEIGDHVLGAREVHGLGDLAWHARAEASREFGETTALLGLSFATGPNATGDDADTQVYGADLYLKWRPDATDAGWPFVAWQTELVWREYEAAAQGAVAAATYSDRGFYTQAVWGFRRPWTAGVRWDWARSDGAFDGDHHRVSAAITYYTSEYARIRFQAAWDDVEGLDDFVSFWLNFSFSLGKHGAHRF